MPSRLLYSTNPCIKLMLQDKFFGGVHYVWCSEHWDNTAAGKYQLSALVPPSSNPRDIYKALRKAVKRGDRHNEHIDRITAGYIARAAQQVADGILTPEEQAELALTLEHADFDHWRPLVYIIPYDAVSSRLSMVPVNLRAGLGVEYTIADLQRSEFDILEF